MFYARKFFEVLPVLLDADNNSNNNLSDGSKPSFRRDVNKYVKDFFFNFPRSLILLLEGCSHNNHPDDFNVGGTL